MDEKIESLRDRLERWIANAERNRLDVTTSVMNNEITLSTYLERKGVIDGKIAGYKDVIGVLRNV